ncbi:MAG: HNH endonuclease [Chlorobiaceae bacterium]|nr:HNH endonuclease [Chlorobiaceae bacterium]NTV61561.1 HNH endonuclease [Chlorobiaceae bacterium]
MPLDHMKVLVLNSSYEPLDICDARKAVILLFGGKAVPVAHHPELAICTVTRNYPLPIVVRLRMYVSKPFRRVLLSRKNIFLRDNYQCQYCGKTDAPLTLDHVLPRSRGGESTWENLITACQRCNSAKGNRTPREADMHPLKKPMRPHHLLTFTEHLSPAVSEHWKPYLYMS